MRKNRHNFFNMYFTTTISITLVLFLVGLVCAIFLCANSISEELKEKVSLSLVLNDSVGQPEVERISRMLTVGDYAKSVTYVSKEEALQEYITELGEDPALFLGYNPLLASLEVSLNADYAHVDSIQMIETKLRPFTGIKRVIYHQELINAIDKNVRIISWILSAFAVLMLVFSLVLINNTIRLSVYSKRFIIHTMRLVGATPWFIRAPFVRKHMLVGLIASLLALGLLFGTGYYLRQELGIAFVSVDYMSLGILAVGLIAVGLLITFFSSYWAVGKYIRLKTDDLYYI